MDKKKLFSIFSDLHKSSTSHTLLSFAKKKSTHTLKILRNINHVNLLKLDL